MEFLILSFEGHSRKYVLGGGGQIKLPHPVYPDFRTKSIFFFYSRTYICHKCGVAYSSKHTLSGHVREKHPVYYLCTYCEKMFQSTTKLRIHYSHQHEVNALSKEFYICWKCKKSCSSFNDLDDHLGMNSNNHREQKV